MKFFTYKKKETQLIVKYSIFKPRNMAAQDVCDKIMNDKIMNKIKISGF